MKKTDEVQKIEQLEAKVAELEGELSLSEGAVQSITWDLDELREKHTQLLQDEARLDYMQGLLDACTYTGRCVLRKSRTGRGWRLHETSTHPGSETSVRVAIDNAMVVKSAPEQSEVDA